MANDQKDLRPDVIEAGPVRVDRGRGLAFLDDRAIELPPKEFDMLAWLVHHAGRPVSSEELKARVWPEDAPVTVEDVHRHVYRLRKRLGDRRRRPALISNRRGYGYVLNPSPRAPARKSVAARAGRPTERILHQVVQDLESGTVTPRIRVLIADENAGERDTMIELLGAEEEMEVMSARDLEQALQLVQVDSPDVALVDVGIADGHGARAVRELRRLSPRSRVLAWSAWRDHDKVGLMLRAGAAGTLLKGSPPEEIVAALRGVETDVGPAEGGAAAEKAPPRDDVDGHRMERLRRVCSGEGLAVAFQPVVELGSGRVVGLEALARFSLEPRRPPEMWFAEAAEMGLGVDLELAVLRAATRQQAGTSEDVFLSVNASPAAIESRGLEELLLPVLADRSLVIEVSVASRVASWPAIDEGLLPLRAAGARLAADDVGAGPATLDHLVLLGPDFIKLDALLVRGVEEDTARRELVRTIASLGARMGAALVAEGVESEAEVDALLSLGVEYGQGNHLAPAAPMPFGERSAEATPA